MFSSWLYVDENPFTMLEPLSVYEELKNLNGTGYFEELIKEYLIDNQHGTSIVLEPKKGLNLKEEKELSEELGKYKASLSEEKIEKLIKDTKALKKYQEEPSLDSDLEKLPLLQVSDIKKEIEPFTNELRDIDETKVIYHNIETNGIAYIKLLFDSGCLSKEDISYASLLKYVLGLMDTNKHSYEDLSNEINSNCGGIGFSLKYFSNLKSNDRIVFSAGAKGLYSQMSFLFEAITEIITGTDMSDDQRLYEIIAEIKSKLQMQLQSAGHSTASTRAMAYFSNGAGFTDYTDGLGFYKFIKDIEENFEDRKNDVRTKLKNLLDKIFNKNNFFVDCTATEEGYKKLEVLVKKFKNVLSDSKYDCEQTSFILGKKNEGFKMASQVQYVARCGNFKDKGLEYSGHLKVLKNIMSYEYLWNQVRVLGGAYGCMNNFKRLGDAYFVSYRDPNLVKTNEVYENAAAFVKNAQFDERTITKFIIGAISDMDTPLTPAARGTRSFSAYLSAITEEMLQKERDEVLTTTLEDIKDMSKYIEAFMQDDYICVLGNENLIEENKDMFVNIESI